MKTVLLLGAASDVGRALAQAFAQRGDRLLLAARRPDEQLADLVADLRIRWNAEARAVAFDALAPDTHRAFYEGLPWAPDIAICVFGYLGEADTARKDFVEARRILDTNFTGAVSILDLVAQDFERRRAGAIVGLGSVAGDRGRQSNYHYGSAKAGLAAYLSGLRNRLFPAGVLVLTVKPGFIDTKMTEGLKLPPPLTAQPEQVARDILRALERKKDVLYTLWMWRWIMLLIRHIPERLFKRLKM
jgi:decaprenylphospho-beta-D-erythro-pentofuranosid-2-ulose 2-reductase